MAELSTIHYHYHLAGLIHKYGEVKEKKHGRWVKYSLPNNQFLELDSHNKAIKLKKGNGEYDYWLGFTGDTIIYFGSDFGKFETNVAKQVYQSAISCIKLTPPYEH